MKTTRSRVVSLLLAGASCVCWAQDSKAQIDAKVLQIQQAIRNAGAKWQAGDNPMAHLTAAQKRSLTMPLQVLPQTTAPRPSSLAPLRASIDWRSEGGKNYVTPVKDQLYNCGTCWIFSSLGALESQWAIKHGVHNPTLDLSEQHVSSCMDTANYDQCNGGWPITVFQFARTHGVVEEACYPYADGHAPCGGLCPESGRKVRRVTGFDAIEGATNDEIKALLNHGPVVATLQVYDDLFYYVGGVYAHEWGEPWFLHAVTLVGYDDAEGCWIIKNSWGTEFGVNGYFKMAYVNDSKFPTGQTVGNIRLNYDHIKVPDDFDGNGCSDLLWRNDTTGQVVVQPVDNGLLGAPVVVHTEPNQAWKLVGTGDFSGDGRSELLWWNSTTGQVYQQVMDGASVASGTIVYTEPDTNWKIVGIADFNGDGRSDLLWRHAVSGSVYVMPMNGTAVLPGNVLYTEPDPAWEIVMVADRDGDGKADLLWRHSGTGQVYQMMIDGAPGGTVSIESQDMLYTGLDLNWRIAGTGDFNGDGNADLLWRNVNNGSIYMMFMRGDQVLPSSDQVTIELDPANRIAAIGDYDGDGKSDLLWWNSNTGQVWRTLMDGRTIKSDVLVYTEPDTAWKLLK